MNRKTWLPLAILAVGFAGVGALVATRETPEPRKPEEPAPLVRVIEVSPRDWRFVVRTHGTVVPRTESDLVPQVSGEIIWVAPSLVSGGFFEKGEALLRLDRADAEVELRATRAAAARAQSEYERARTEVARQRTLGAEGVAAQARIDDAENAFRVADANVRETRARLARAERDLERTELRAPFTGRVRSEDVDVGQFVARGQTLGTLYAVDTAEVRLPIPDRELRYVDIPIGARAADPATAAALPEVRLHAEFAGRPHTWQGRVVRTEGEIDPRSRMVHVVAQVEDPYGLDTERESPPLAVGLFVEAEIVGRRVEDVFVLPRAALRADTPTEGVGRAQVAVVDDEQRLRLREVQVLRTERDVAVIGAGLSPGERVSISRLEAAVDGMRVRVAGGPEADEASSAGPTAALATGSTP